MQIVNGAGHHVYADAPDEFNQYVKEACAFVDLATNQEKSPLNGRVLGQRSPSDTNAEEKEDNLEEHSEFTASLVSP